MITTALWSFAVFLASVFGAMLSVITLKPKYSRKVMILLWCIAGVIGYMMSFAAYHINLTDDTVGILGLTALVVLFVVLFYEGTTSEKLFISLTACLIDNVCTFMFCGTTDTVVGRRLGLITESPYDTPNLLFFIAIKLAVYAVFFFLYRQFLRKPLQDMMESLGGNLGSFVAAPAVSVLGFYIINIFTNRNNIYPDNRWFFPLYLTICLIFVIEFWLLYYSVLQSSRAMKSAAELGVAANIQKSMLPCIFPPFPERKEVDIYATMDPAKEVGGDFYDFFMVDESHLAIVMADVSGKGVPAALFMVIGKTLIKDHTRPGRDLGEVFTEVNRLLCESNSEGMFITAFEGVLDLETGEFCFVNAGHEMPFIRKAKEEFKSYRIRPGFVLAGMEGINYKAGSMKLEAGDKIFQYTDGVTEATNAQNELYGMERLSRILNQWAKGTPMEILQAVKTDIGAFVGNAPQFDDITMLCLEFKSKMRELTLDALVENIGRATAFVEEQLEEIGCPQKARLQIDIAVDELFGNIAKYAYHPGTGPVTVRVEAEHQPLCAVIAFIDQGIPYNPLAKEDPDIAAPAGEREIGGLGIYMVKKTMDDVVYEYRDGQNILTIKKKMES